jgi:putative endonuclease
MSFPRKWESIFIIKMTQYYVYILASKKNGTLYIGMTNDLRRRVYEHKNHLIDGFTKKYNVDRLVYFKMTNDPQNAIIREKRLKKWKRQWKIDLIEQMNPEWKDLYFELTFVIPHLMRNPINSKRRFLLLWDGQI